METVRAGATPALPPAPEVPFRQALMRYAYSARVPCALRPACVACMYMRVYMQRVYMQRVHSVHSVRVACGRGVASWLPWLPWLPWITCPLLKNIFNFFYFFLQNAFDN